ncbi:MAG: ATP-binding protein, partial [Hungatella sp.]
RLKTLTEDLVEASKASSGNLKLEIARIDIVELIQQTNGEFEEKFALRHLEMVSHLPNQVIFIEADGRRLWRVLENLYNNAFKYAMEQSRVYIDITANDGWVSITIKNISENPLNINAGELTERFVRGDVARTTEGSGLGLSIAKSLTELQGGRFELYIDGDLFKAQISFPTLVIPTDY